MPEGTPRWHASWRERPFSPPLWLLAPMVTIVAWLLMAVMKHLQSVDWSQVAVGNEGKVNRQGSWEIGTGTIVMESKRRGCRLAMKSPSFYQTLQCLCSWD